GERGGRAWGLAQTPYGRRNRPGTGSFQRSASPCRKPLPEALRNSLSRRCAEVVGHNLRNNDLAEEFARDALVKALPRSRPERREARPAARTARASHLPSR